VKAFSRETSRISRVWGVSGTEGDVQRAWGRSNFEILQATREINKENEAWDWKESFASNVQVCKGQCLSVS
jgi:hypothetical protein